MLLVPEAPAAGLRSPPSPRPARAESATHLFAGASAVEQHRVPNGGRGLGPQVRNGVSSRTFHAVSGPDSLDSKHPGWDSSRLSLSQPLYSNLSSRFPFPDLKSVFPVLPPSTLPAVRCVLIQPLTVVDFLLSAHDNLPLCFPRSRALKWETRCECVPSSLLPKTRPE